MAKHKKGYANTEGGKGPAHRPTSAGHVRKMAHHALHKRTQHGHDSMAHHTHGPHDHMHGHYTHHGHGDHKGVHGFHGLTTPPDECERGECDGGKGMHDNCHMED